jgi:hypothetical protein
LEVTTDTPVFGALAFLNKAAFPKPEKVSGGFYYESEYGKVS